MKKAIMNVSRFGNEDVIATSDGNGFATYFTLTNFGDGSNGNGTITFDNGTGTVSINDYSGEMAFENLFRSNFNLGSATINGIKCDGRTSGVTFASLYGGEKYYSNTDSGLSTKYTWDAVSGYFLGDNLS